MGARPRPRVLLGALAAVALLLLTAPSPLAALHQLQQLQQPAAAAEQAAPLVALISLIAWLLTGWLALTVCVTAGGHLPGRTGRAVGAIAVRVAPAGLRRAVEVALGLTVAVGVLGASPAAAAPGSAPSLDWSAPVTTPAVTAPALDWSATAAPVAACVLAAVAPPAAALTRSEVVVRSGDSLWRVAERHLASTGKRAPTTAEVAQAWPSWWAANREAVGDDPHLIRPGTHLRPPTS